MRILVTGGALAAHAVDAVIHMAAYSLVGESMTNPERARSGDPSHSTRAASRATTRIRSRYLAAALSQTATFGRKFSILLAAKDTQ